MMKFGKASLAPPYTSARIVRSVRDAGVIEKRDFSNLICIQRLHAESNRDVLRCPLQHDQSGGPLCRGAEDSVTSRGGESLPRTDDDARKYQSDSDFPLSQLALFRPGESSGLDVTCGWAALRLHINLHAQMFG
jgi:hypothetical protein